jgi:NAD(P)-dependent dehydrogenase (short-subunit alcohol dehydrogenase family)
MMKEVSMAGTMTGKTALVTGAASGIGRAIALAFAHEGANVVVGDVNENGGKETVGLVEQGGAKGLFIECDVSKPEAVKGMVEKTVKEFGSLDYACNDAGIHNPLPEAFTELDENMWDAIIAVNLKGVMLCMKHEIPPMLKQGGGVIVNIASLGGLLAEPGSHAYTASKHGVMGLTKTVAFEYAKTGIRINAVCPAVIETPMFAMAPPEVRQALLAFHPIGRFGKPEEIAAAVMWLCSDLSAFVTGTGVVLDGGASAV